MLDRISQILKTKKLSASQFAVSIGVQPSSVSHVLSGRNKPSLDFISKILSTYPDINAEWLIMGKGEVIDTEPKKPVDSHTRKTGQTSFDLDNEATRDNKGNSGKTETKIPETLNEKPAEKPVISGDDGVEKIVLFYKNGTFREYIPGKSS